MHTAQRIYTAATTRLLRYRRAPRRDRGDSPVPSAIIIAGLAIIAVGLLVWLTAYVGGFMDAAPTELPGGPADGGGDGR